MFNHAICCREAGAGLVELFIPKANRETMQRALNRGNALMVTAVEMDFAFAADRPVSATCNAILSAANLWRSIGRSSIHPLLLIKSAFAKGLNLLVRDTLYRA